MNYHKLLKIPYKIHGIIIIVFFLLIIVTICLSKYSFYDVYNTYGYIKDEKLILNIPLSYSDTITNLECLKINGENSNVSSVSISEVLLDSNSLVNYQEVSLNINSTYEENLVLKITIYYNKEKISEKIKKLII